MKQKSMLFLFHFLIIVSGFGQKMEFLPKENIWQTQSLDPLASQSFTGIATVWENDQKADYISALFSFGYQKSIFSWTKAGNKWIDIGIEGSAITQFEWTNRPGYMQRNILSTDFIVGMPVVWHLKPMTFRFRFYHLSSHMGDDYMIRNGITSYYRNNNNYEQFDVTASYLFRNLRMSIGIGTILRASTERKPLVFSLGAEYLSPLNEKESVSFFTGFFADSKQDNDYKPSINIGTGIKLGKTDRRGLKILATYFHGPLPYSVYQGRPIQWLGLSVYVNPF